MIYIYRYTRANVKNARFRYNRANWITACSLLGSLDCCRVLFAADCAVWKRPCAADCIFWRMPMFILRFYNTPTAITGQSSWIIPTRSSARFIHFVCSCYIFPIIWSMYGKCSHPLWLSSYLMNCEHFADKIHTYAIRKSRKYTINSMAKCVHMQNTLHTHCKKKTQKRSRARVAFFLYAQTHRFFCQLLTGQSQRSERRGDWPSPQWAKPVVRLCKEQHMYIYTNIKRTEYLYIVYIHTEEWKNCSHTIHTKYMYIYAKVRVCVRSPCAFQKRCAHAKSSPTSPNVPTLSAPYVAAGARHHKHLDVLDLTFTCPARACARANAYTVFVCMLTAHVCWFAYCVVWCKAHRPLRVGC